MLSKDALLEGTNKGPDVFKHYIQDEKDVLSPVSHGVHAGCFNSETSNIPKNIIKKLSYRFKHIILFYDSLNLDLQDLRIIMITKNQENHLIPKILVQDSLYSETPAILKPCEIDFNNPPIRSEMLISINDVSLGIQGNLLGITGGEGTHASHRAKHDQVGILSYDFIVFA